MGKGRMLQSSRRDALSCIWIIVLVAMAYGLALRNGYVWDDRYFLTDYAWIGSYGDALRSSLLPLFNQGSYFRPLPLFSLYAEAIASDRNPAVAHGVALARSEERRVGKGCRDGRAPGASQEEREE